jgi:hypothetical protein
VCACVCLLRVYALSCGHQQVLCALFPTVERAPRIPRRRINARLVVRRASWCIGNGLLGPVVIPGVVGLIALEGLLGV